MIDKVFIVVMRTVLCTRTIRKGIEGETLVSPLFSFVEAVLVGA